MIFDNVYDDGLEIDRRAKQYAYSHGCRCTTLGCQHYRQALSALISEASAPSAPDGLPGMSASAREELRTPSHDGRR